MAMNVADAHSGKVSVPGGELVYDVLGHGTPLVLIHAAIADRKMWDREMLSYPRRYRVVRYDLRGYGDSRAATEPYSNADDLRALLDELGFDSVDLIGASMGGLVALDFALQHPTRARRVVAVGSGLGLFEPGDDARVKEAFLSLDLVFAKVTTAWKAGNLDEVVERLLETFGPGLMESSRSQIAAMIRRNAEEIATDRSTSHATGRLTRERLSGIRAPTLVVTGTRDHPALRWSSHQLVAALLNARCLDLIGGDHFPMFSRTSEFDAAVFEFLSR